MRTLLPRALLLLVGLVIGCTGGHDGRFLVVVSSDIPSPDQLARVRVEVGEEAHEFVLGEGTRLPFSFAVDARPGRPDQDPVTVVVSGLDATGAVLMSFPVTTRFRPNRTLVLPVTLLRRCTALALCGEQLRCGASEACTPDGCVPADVDADDLREISTPGDEVVASLTPEGVCVELADLHCAAIFRCCSSAGSLPPDDQASLRARCLEQIEADCRTNFLPLFDDPRTGFDGARASAALAAGDALTRQCSLSYAQWGASLEQGILSSLVGTVAQGGACGFSEAGEFFSCRDGACVLEGAAAQCGARACLGQPCFDAQDIDVLAALADNGCNDELFCAQGGDGPRCERVLPDGAECFRNGQCASRICNRPLGTCADGTQCSVSTDCPSPACDTTSNTCHDGTTCGGDECAWHDCAREVGVCAPLTIENLYCPG
ncbi:MAG: hypothetical protein J0L92_07035 [Deltaproteobacteria bacterium]|nr:hypothetical protein [Deltaproteobacteria bacterium]